MNIILYFFIGLLTFQEPDFVVCTSDSGCPNQLVTPYPTNCANMLMPANSPANIICNSQCRPTTTNCVTTLPCCSLTSICCSASQICCTSTSTCCCQTTNCCSQQPPDPIQCPPGTILVGNSCFLIYCAPGSQMVNGRCVVTECPEGSIWSGHSCLVSQPTVTNVTFHNTIITKFNQTRPQIILNNTNSIYINASLIISDDVKYNNDCNYGDDDCDELNLATQKPTLTCCVVMTPRLCEHRAGRWRCFSRRSRRCGEFCIAPIIYLRTSRTHVKNQYLVMPPIHNDCKMNRNCDSLTGPHDCSGCALNIMERCSNYCYRYTCPSRRCTFYDQETYCAHITGLYVCQEEDGCFDNWCL